MTPTSDDNTETTSVATPNHAHAEAARPAKRLTVLQVLPALGGQGGVERGAVDVAAAIQHAGGRAIVVSAGGPLVHALSRAGAEHVELPVDSKNIWTIRRNIGRLLEIIRREDVDIVHARSRAPAWSAWPAARRAGTAFVTTVHGFYGTGPWLKNRYNEVMTRGDLVIAISRFIAGHIRQVYGLPASRIRVIHRGVDVERFNPQRISADRMVSLARKWRLDTGRPVVMLPGRLSRWKGQVTFLDSIAKLQRRDLTCVVLGSDQGRERYRKELEDLIHRHDLGGVVRLVDHCDDMPAAYMLSDLVVSASIEPEAFGRVLAEAQAVGRSVIGADHGGARETVIPDVSGWLVPPGDSKALAAAIDRGLALTPAARQRMADAAISNVRGEFTKETMCARTLAVYDEVLRAKAGR